MGTIIANIDDEKAAKERLIKSMKKGCYKLGDYKFIREELYDRY